jgi:hypothetical protein
MEQLQGQGHTMGEIMSQDCLVSHPRLGISELLAKICPSQSTKAEAGHYIQVIAAYLASLQMIIATSGYHSGIIST